MRKRTTKLFGEVEIPASLNQLLSALNARQTANKVFMWRGQANIDWRIDSSAYRRLSLTRGTVTESDLRFYEESLLDQAKHRGFDVFEGNILSDLDVLARLQHHGAATRLVDASRNVLVALWFASTELPRTTGVLIGFHSDGLGGYEGLREEHNYSEVVDSLSQYHHPQTWEPPDGVSPRISAQRSQFLYSAVSPSVEGSLYYSRDPKTTTFYAISQKVKAEALLALSQAYDIRMLTLFPDIEGFCLANSTRYTEESTYRW